ncbi:TonB-dependent receptor [Aureicoccus marinus]|uniref:TonB-dependent receptor n=1 Tax=Aureicoccus marinus TaxID=754435 RepID=A0A2S7T958_9FLAO|nr:TonB-dependent receptor [Aureicoccus marinus]PQJ16459.1 TonB-dependent receptor [Aureicoccus marinus]
MRTLITALAFIISSLAIAQESTGSIAGKMTDADFNDEPLAFANVLIKGTTQGTTSDFDGLYEISGLEPGTYTVVFSYVGYETREVVDVVVEAGKISEVNVSMSASAEQLEEVVVTVVRRQDSQVAQLISQKKAVTVVESIGAQELGKLAVSDAAKATTKISGVTASQGSGDIFVRGLGDRYLSTTLNGLPVPSDDVERKNISLNLFPTRVIQNVSVSKTYSALNSADQASGVINVSSRELQGDNLLQVSLSSGVNTNVSQEGVFDNFRISPNINDATLGFYLRPRSIREQVISQGWNTQTLDNPVNYTASIAAGKKFFDNKLAVLVTASHGRSNGYQQGVFRQFRGNALEDTITDATNYTSEIVNSALADLTWFINDKNKLKSTTFFINKYAENVFEGGRAGNSTIFEEDDLNNDSISQFIRDQNVKRTQLLVTQLAGTHKLNDKHNLEWAVGYNLLYADEPNRIRNEVNFNPREPEDLAPGEVFDPTNPGAESIQLGFTGGFQQRKSAQQIEDIEYNGYIKDVINLIDKEETAFKIEVGAAYRNKERDFYSEFVGVEERNFNTVTASSLDDLGSIFTASNFSNGLLQLNVLGANANGDNADIYSGRLESQAAFADFNINLNNKWNFNAGFRYQRDQINVNYDVGNLALRVGESNQEYNNFYPALNIKYSLNEQQAIRFAASRTITLPEFKEIAPFEYVSPVGQVTRGNPDVEASIDFNYDLKWEWFPTPGQLISVAAFYKDIKDPINRVRDRGSAGVFSYFNTSERAEVVGLELETKLDLIKATTNEEGEATGNELSMVFNATRMWTNQDLIEQRTESGALIRSFRYKTISKTNLQGAPDYIINSSLNFNTAGVNPFGVSLTANYASDKIFALGVPTDQINRDIFYDDAIVEKGFVVLDATVTKDLGEHWQVRLTGRNLLNPDIRQTQLILRNIRDLAPLPIDQRLNAQRVEEEVTVRSYNLGRTISLGFNYNF